MDVRTGESRNNTWPINKSIIVFPIRFYYIFTTKCYRPYISSSTTTRKRHKRASSGSAGDARTSRAIG